MPGHGVVTVKVWEINFLCIGCIELLWIQLCSQYLFEGEQLASDWSAALNRHRFTVLETSLSSHPTRRQQEKLIHVLSVFFKYPICYFFSPFHFKMFKGNNLKA